MVRASSKQFGTLQLCIKFPTLCIDQFGTLCIKFATLCINHYVPSLLP